ncbi:MAG: M42 family metallopeptidase [Anaerolineae bacterium]|nr:M42 family metallopeptidase [Anaerolineae bacterium]MDH7474869.1 M42 family metallopeptidase [Anaerolineae bacterium]
MILQQLSEAFGVSGYEDAVRQIIFDAIRNDVDEYRVDSIGNLITLKRGTGEAPFKVMVTAHMDEIGLMITHIEDNGQLRFAPVGGIDDRILLSKTVCIGDKKIPGIIGVKPIHLQDDKEQEQVIKGDKLTIDIGATSKAEAEQLVKVGDYVAFTTSFADLGPTVKGKAFDDRAGCAVLIEIIKAGPYPFDLYGVFTVQEEVGLRGAQVAAYAIEPDVAFVLEGTICDDMPKKKDVSPTTELGRGPAITIMDRTFIADRRLVKLLVDTATELGIPYQFKQPLMGGTDAGAIHTTRTGVPSVTVAVPSRYIHSPVCLLSKSDFENTARLMQEALRRLTPATIGK